MAEIVLPSPHDKEEIENLARALGPQEMKTLADMLEEKDDKLRYPAFLLLQARSGQNGDLMPFWNTFAGKLQSENSYSRSIGLMLLAANARWADGGQLEGIIDSYLNLLEDVKPITVRQCIQGLYEIIPCGEKVRGKIARQLLSFDVMSIRETMRKSVLGDILGALLLLRKYDATPEIESYMHRALAGSLLDAKAKKELKEKLQNP